LVFLWAMMIFLWACWFGSNQHMTIDHENVVFHDRISIGFRNVAVIALCKPIVCMFCYNVLQKFSFLQLCWMRSGCFKIRKMTIPGRFTVSKMCCIASIRLTKIKFRADTTIYICYRMVYRCLLLLAPHFHFITCN